MLSTRCKNFLELSTNRERYASFYRQIRKSLIPSKPPTSTRPCNQGRNFKGLWEVSHPPTLKTYLFAGQKQHYNVFSQDNLLDPGPFDQLLLLKKMATESPFLVHSKRIGAFVSCGKRPCIKRNLSCTEEKVHFLARCCQC